MTTIFLTNLAQWSLQVALLAAVAALLLRVVKIGAPVVRHAFLRVLLLVCLILPAVQPWRQPPALVAHSDVVTVVAPALPLIEDSDSANRPSLFSTAMRTLQVRWVDWIALVLAAGTGLRLSWLVVGFVRLRRLRRMGEPAALGSDQNELAELARIGADVKYVSRLGQPVTFGLFKPVVLLPDSLPALPAPLQRAVLAHELWHVRRRDWGWVVVEETIRAVLWFNPAIWWLVSQVQSSREEVVDELTVRLTNGRKAYLEALLVFADEPTLFPATPFARRRHLFHRMLLISSEAVMSSRRILTSTIAALAAVAATSWYGVSAFPLTAAPAPGIQPQSMQTPPRDRRPGEPGPETSREVELKKALAADASNPDLYFQLAGLQEGRGASAEAEATWDAVRRAFPNNKGLLAMLARTYSQTGRFDQAIATLEDLAALDPNEPQPQQLLTVFYWEKAFKDKSLTPDQTLSYVKAGIASSDKALAISPDYVEALTYKNILLRMQANMEIDPARRQVLIAEADALRNRAMELNKTRSSMTFVAAPGQPPPPPPPPPPHHEFSPLVDGLAPLRVGGNIKPPTKVRDVKPIYPPEAQAARVQGVVIIEATINSSGEVVHTRVLRGSPMLDQAAVDAVQQWQFTPTLLNNAPVPVIMTVTVNFTVDSGPSRGGPPVVAADIAYPPPPPPPPPSGHVQDLVDGLAPVRVGGTIKPPTKIRDVKPVYPVEALAAGVQGVVIIEAVIDTAGNVVSGRVIRGVPTLDEAAVEAVQQWQFTPTLLDNAPVPVIMTVTVNFTQQ